MWPFGKKQGTEAVDMEILCPRCGISMHKLTQRNVTIDVCPKCSGMWLDHGELNKLLEIKQSIASRGRPGKSKVGAKTAKHKKKA